jgi:predicted DNA-binding transcriptional regulator AlpA
MSRKEAMVYTGCKTLATFYHRIRQGILPGPIPGTHTWDRKAIDAALDLVSGLKSGISSSSPLDEWMARRARATQGT